MSSYIVQIEYETDQSGKKIDSHNNKYAELLARDLARTEPIRCRNGCSPVAGYYEITIGSVTTEDGQSVVDILSVTPSCCPGYLSQTRAELKERLTF